MSDTAANQPKKKDFMTRMGIRDHGQREVKKKDKN